ncbi:MAG TPA: DUF1800 domain-containing protein [Verrucomicrobiae bacterium]|nr:DUF1800 domain-containing protein [Verrucomicrobiae bacterium]
MALTHKHVRRFMNFRSVISSLLAGALLIAPSLDAASPKDKKPKQDTVLKGLPISDLTADEAIFHALNRLAYGPRPGDIERIKRIGLSAWIDQQLNANSIDDKAVQARLDDLPALRLSTAKLIEDYPQAKQAAKKAAVAQKLQNPAQTRADQAAATVVQDSDVNSGSMQHSNANADMTNADTPSSMKQPSANTATPGAGQRAALSVDPNAVPRVIADDSKRPQRVIEELAMSKMIRAVYSDRQLQQVMDDFWFNHFNVFAGKGEDRYYLTSYERDVIQPHALGKFKDLLTASAKSPAMLFYLDNFLSADPRAAQRQAQQRAMRQQSRGGWNRLPRPMPQTNPQAQNKKKQQRGLNENYGRELMELHTLGVDSGYTQKDVTEVARCFTGWTIDKPRENPQFKFDDRIHDPDPKIVLGKKIHAGGMKDGEQVMELLSRNPHTARFISTKLARRFVSDNPPPALVARMAATFKSSDGDIRAVMRTMIYSPEFWTRDAYRAKIKTPFEFVVSTVRALGTDVDTPMPLVQWVARIGEPLYQCQPPTGYSDKAETWVNTGALLNRLNFSLVLAGNKVRGSRTDAPALFGLGSSADSKQVLDRAVELFLGGEAAANTVATLQKQLDDPQVVKAKLDDPVKQADLAIVTGLVLGAPEFQRR